MSIHPTGPEATLGPVGRGWIYLRERFPPGQYAIAIAAFAWAVLAYARALDGVYGVPGAYPLFVGWMVTLLAFLQLRLLDEFKDREEDARYRPYRPVPRGLVTLRALGRAWLAIAALQVVLSWTLGPLPLVLLAAVLAYSGLMRVEFFARDWLKRHALAYMASHMLIIPMMATYIAACAGPVPRLAAFAPLLAMSYLNFSVFEIGRKICAPAEERNGVETYSALWGPRRAVLAWLAGLWGGAVLAVVAAHAAGVAAPVTAVALALAIAAGAVAARFLGTLAHAKGSLFKAASGAWLLAIHVTFGLALALHS